jgi:hypothetical protein
MDRPVIHLRLYRGLDQPVLIEPAQALELGRLDESPEVVSASLVDHLDLGARKGLLDQRLDLGREGQFVAPGGEAEEAAVASAAAFSISSIRTNFTRGRPCGSPRATSARSIAPQPA